MSGCYESKTLNICPHNVPVKLGCDKCLIDARFYEIEHKIAHLLDGIDRCFERVECVEKWKEWIENIEETAYRADRKEQEFNNHIKGVECNCRLDNRSHEIQTRACLNDLWTRQKLLEETVKILQDTRITKLESNHLDQLNPEAFLIIKKRCDDIEEIVYEVKEKQLNCDRKPFKCPVCEGKGKLWPDGTIGYHRCEPCEGKGIVWG